MMKYWMFLIAMLSLTSPTFAQAAGLVLPADICDRVKKSDDETITFTKEILLANFTYMDGTRIGRRNATPEGIEMFNSIDRTCFSKKR